MGEVKTTAWTRDELEEMAHDRRRARAPAHAFAIGDEDAALLHAALRPRAYDVVAVDPRAIAACMTNSIEANRAARQFGEALGGVTPLTRGRLAGAMAAMDRAVAHPWMGTADEWTEAIDRRDAMRRVMGLLAGSPPQHAAEQPPPLTSAMRLEAILGHMRAIAQGEGGEVIFREIAAHAATRSGDAAAALAVLRADLVRKLAHALASAGSSDVDALARIAESVSRL